MSTGFVYPTGRHLSTAERMAVAVLSGDLDAARALADLLAEDYSIGARDILPEVLESLRPQGSDTYKSRRIVGQDGMKHLRVIAYLKRSRRVTAQGVNVLEWQHEVDRWVRGSEYNSIITEGLERVEVFELPESCRKVRVVK